MKYLYKENNIVLTHPNVSKEWHPTKNGDLKPEYFTSGMKNIVWWKCEKGHEWSASIYNRTVHNSKCPYCLKKKALVGLNDLCTTNPELLKEWHPTKNENLSPNELMAGSNRKVWWICEKGHEWQSTVAIRVYNKSGCPICASKKILVGFNDLTTTNPELVKEWNYEKNENLIPESFSRGSSQKVWWVDELGHEWQARIIDRAIKGSKCPFCYGKKVLEGFNDLATLRPDIANQWDFVKNGDLKPTDVRVGSEKKVWWKCEKGHVWQSTICNRTLRNQGCPICNNKI